MASKSHNINALVRAALRSNRTQSLVRKSTTIQSRIIAYSNDLCPYVNISNDGGASFYKTPLAPPSFTSLTMPSTSNWSDMVYGGGKFFAIASGTTSAASSTDGITWSASTLVDNKTWVAIDYGNSRYVALSSEGVINYYISSWNSASIGSGTSWSGIAYGNGIFVAVGTDGSFATSTDGISWSVGKTAFVFRDVAFGNGTFVACDSGNFYYSFDGMTWTATSVGIPYNVNNISFCNNLFICAVGKDGSNAYVAYSSDGIQWNAVTAALPFESGGLNHYIVGGNSVFLMFYQGTQYAYAVDPRYWTSVGYGNYYAVSRAVAFGNNIISQATYGTAAGFYYSNPYTFTMANTIDVGAGVDRPLHVVILNNGTTNYVYFSYNGTTFSNVYTNAGTRIIKYFSNKDLYNYIAKSGANYLRWYGGGVPAGNGSASFSSGITTDTLDFVWTGTKFILVGLDFICVNNFAYDGTKISFGNAAYPFGAGITIKRIAKNGITSTSTYVLVGSSGSVAYTTNSGTSFTSVSSGFGSNDVNDIDYATSVFVIGGNNNNMAYSSNGITWTAISSPFSAGDNIVSVKYYDKWYATTNTGKIATSVNGITWSLAITGLTKLVGLSANFSAYNGHKADMRIDTYKRYKAQTTSANVVNNLNSYKYVTYSEGASLGRSIDINRVGTIILASTNNSLNVYSFANNTVTSLFTYYGSASTNNASVGSVVAISNDGLTLVGVSYSDNSVTIVRCTAGYGSYTAQVLTGFNFDSLQKNPVSLSHDGQLLVIGDSRDSVWVYKNVAGTFTLNQTITNPATSKNAAFGYAVAISGDGSTLVIGDPLHQIAGAAFIYKNDGSNNFNFFSILSPQADGYVGGVGYSVAVSYSGNFVYMIINDYQESDYYAIFGIKGFVIYSKDSTSNAYSFVTTHVLSNAIVNAGLINNLKTVDDYSLFTINSQAGVNTVTFWYRTSGWNSVPISTLRYDYGSFAGSGFGNVVVQGGSGQLWVSYRNIPHQAHSTNLRTVYKNGFLRTQTSSLLYNSAVTGTTTILQDQRIAGENVGDLFGFSTSIDRTGTWLAVGAPGYNTSNGAIYLYKKVGSTFTYVNKYVGNNNSNLGQCVKFSGDGTRLFATGKDGTISCWILAGNWDSFNTPNFNYALGYSILALRASYDGTKIVVSEGLSDTGGRVRALSVTSSGMFIIWTLSLPHNRITWLNAGAPSPTDVAISPDGLRIAVANETVGIYNYSAGTYSLAVSIAGVGNAGATSNYKIALSNNYFIRYNAAYFVHRGSVFYYDGTNYTNIASLDGFYGTPGNLEISEDEKSIVVSKVAGDINVGYGLFYLFRNLSGNTWTSTQLISYDALASQRSMFGFSTALSKNAEVIISSAPYFGKGTANDLSTGAVYVMSTNRSVRTHTTQNLLSSNSNVPRRHLLNSLLYTPIRFQTTQANKIANSRHLTDSRLVTTKSHTSNALIQLSDTYNDDLLYASINGNSVSFIRSSDVNIIGYSFPAAGITGNPVCRLFFYGSGKYFIALNNGSLFCLVNSKIVKCTTDFTVSASYIFYSAVYFNGYYYAVGNTIIRSTDLLNWQTVLGVGGTVTGIDLSTIVFNSIAASPSRLVAVGNNGAVFFSDDGVTWISNRIDPINTTTLARVIYQNSNHGFMIVGGSFVYRTYDGISFIPSFNNIPSNATINSIAYGNGYYLVILSTNFHAYSSDGSNWTVVASQSLSNLAFSNGKFWANLFTSNNFYSLSNVTSTWSLVSTGLRDSGPLSLGSALHAFDVTNSTSIYKVGLYSHYNRMLIRTTGTKTLNTNLFLKSTVSKTLIINGLLKKTQNQAQLVNSRFYGTVTKNHIATVAVKLSVSKASNTNAYIRITNNVTQLIRSLISLPTTKTHNTNLLKIKTQTNSILPFIFDFNTITSGTLSSYAALNGDASYNTGYVQLTPPAATKQGSLVFTSLLSNRAGFNASRVSLSFDILIDPLTKDSGTISATALTSGSLSESGGQTVIADGMSVSYGPIASSSNPGYQGDNNSLVIGLNTNYADNPGIHVKWGGLDLAYYNMTPFPSFADGSWHTIEWVIDNNNVGYVRIDNAVVLTNINLPSAFITADKNGWYWSFSGKTTYQANRQLINNIIWKPNLEVITQSLLSPKAINQTVDAKASTPVVAIDHNTNTLLKLVRAYFTFNQSALKASLVKTNTTDTILRITQQYQTESNSLLRASYSLTQQSNSSLRSANTRNNNTNILLLKAEALLNNVNSLLRSTVTKTQNTDALLRNLFSKLLTADILLKSSNTRLTATASLLRATFTTISQVDLLKRSTTSLTNNTDATTQVINARSYNIDGLKLKTTSISQNANILKVNTYTSNHASESLINQSFNRSLKSQMMLWRTISGNSINNFRKFDGVSSGLFVFSTPQNLQDVAYDNRIILKEAGWGSRDITPLLSARENINIGVPILANGALFSIYDDRLANVILQNPVSVSIPNELTPQVSEAIAGTKPTAKTRIKTFRAPMLEKSIQLVEPPRKRRS